MTRTAAARLGTRSVRSLSLILISALMGSPGSLAAQTTGAAERPFGKPTESRVDEVTVLSSVGSPVIIMRGASTLRGPTPLEIPRTFQGRYTLVVEGRGVARSHGVVDIPVYGAPPHLDSEPPGLSPALVIRSFAPPGIPAIRTATPERGLVFAAAGVGAAAMAVRAQLTYRARVDEFGDYSMDRARDEQAARDGWIGYGAAVWGLSALDYWIRPRYFVVGATPGLVTVHPPRLTRSAAAWRSLLVPGAGHAAAGKRWRGAMWLGATLASGAAAAITHAEISRNQTKAGGFESLADSAGPSTQAALRAEAARKRSDAEDARRARDGFLLAALVIHAAGVIDALLMPIDEPVTAERPSVSQLPLRLTPTEIAYSVHF